MRHSTFYIDEVKTTMMKGIDDKGSRCHHWDGGTLKGCPGAISTVEDRVAYARSISDPGNQTAALQMNEAIQREDVVKANLGWNERLIVPRQIRMPGINGGTGGYGASLLVNRDNANAVSVPSNAWPWHYMDRLFPLAKAWLAA